MVFKPKVESKSPQSLRTTRKHPLKSSPSRVSNKPTSSTPNLSPSPRRALRSPQRSQQSPLRRTSRKTSPKKIQKINYYVISDSGSGSENESGKNKIVSKSPPRSRPRGRPRSKSRIGNIETLKKVTETISPIENISRSSRSKDSGLVVHLKKLSPLVKRLSEFSDDDNNEKKSKTNTSKSKYKTVKEFGGTLGAIFFILSTPISVMILYILCNQYTCTFNHLPLNISKFKSFSTYFHLKSFVGYLIYIVLYGILSALPFGGRKVNALPSKIGKFTYTTNGIFSLIIMIAIWMGLEFKHIPISNFILEHLFHLLVSSIIVGFLISVYAYVRSFYVPVSALNPSIVPGSRIYNYFIGREINPRLFGKLDMKLFVLKFAITGAILMDFVILFKTIGGTDAVEQLKINHLNPTLAIVILMHLIYFFDAIVFESTWVTSFELQYEGFGYISGVGYSIYPFMTILVTKYVLDYNIELASWKLLIIFLVFIFGYILFRGSNNQKDAFRKNPYSSSVSHLDTITTSQGKKLILSGYWGIVRHPNYLGDIILTLSFVPFVYLVPPVFTIYPIVLFLIHRSARDNARCKQKYGSSWTRYCNRVKYILIPKIY